MVMRRRAHLRPSFQQIEKDDQALMQGMCSAFLRGEFFPWEGESPEFQQMVQKVKEEEGMKELVQEEGDAKGIAKVVQEPEVLVVALGWRFGGKREQQSKSA